MENKCPVCGQEIDAPVCTRCGFEIKQILASSPHPLLQQVEDERLEKARNNWRTLSEREEKVRQLTEENNGLQARLSELQASLDAAENRQPVPQLPIAYLVVYAGGTDMNNLNNIHPIYLGTTIVGRGKMATQPGVHRCKLSVSDSNVKNEHFAITATEDSATVKVEAELREGEWDFGYIGNKPRKTPLQNNDMIIIGGIKLIYKRV